MTNRRTVDLLSCINEFKESAQEQQKQDEIRFQLLLTWAREEYPDVDEDHIFDYIHNDTKELNL